MAQSAAWTNEQSPRAGTSSLADARPIIPRTDEGLLQRVEQIRDELHVTIADTLARHGWRGNVLRSAPHAHPCWVSIELWRPEAGDTLLTRRSSATVTLVPKPYYAHEVEYEIEVNRAGHARHAGSLIRCSHDEVDRLVAYLIDERDDLAFPGVRLRRYFWQLWRPINRPKALATDWAGLCPWVFAATAALCPSLELGMLIGPLVFGGIVALWLLSRRSRLVRTSGKPHGEPRRLTTLDSWQTVVFGIGSNLDDIRQRIVDRLNAPFSELMRWRTERIWYWGLDGITERDQIVVTLGRAITFVHLHRYGNDLYVAWDGHLNRGQWVEHDLYRGIDRASGRLAVIRVVEPGTQTLTEYDLTDANGLNEFVHAQLVQVLKQIIAERQIDQEIDFKVLRAERQGILSSQDGLTGRVAEGANRVRNFIRRIG